MLEKIMARSWVDSRSERRTSDRGADRRKRKKTNDFDPDHSEVENATKTWLKEGHQITQLQPAERTKTDYKNLISGSSADDSLAVDQFFLDHGDPRDYLN